MACGLMLSRRSVGAWSFWAISRMVLGRVRFPAGYLAGLLWAGRTDSEGLAMGYGIVPLAVVAGVLLIGFWATVIAIGVCGLGAIAIGNSY